MKATPHPALLSAREPVIDSYHRVPCFSQSLAAHTGSAIRRHLAALAYTTMPPKRGKKGKRRGDSSSDDDASTSAAAAAVTASLKQATLADDSGDENAGKQKPQQTKQPRAKARGKKKGKGGKNNYDSDSDDADALDPLAHLRGGKGKRGGGGDDSDEEDRPKKPLTKKEKRRLEEEQRRREKEVRFSGLPSAETGADAWMAAIVLLYLVQRASEPPRCRVRV